jgi:signal transduction histidine kinase
VSAWAGDTLERSLRQVILRGVALWQAVILVAVVATPEARALLPVLVVLHLGVAGFALVAQSGRGPLWAVSVALAVTMLADWAITDSVNGALSLATVWLCHLANTIPAVLARGWEARVLGALFGFGVPAAVAAFHPSWMSVLVVPVIVTGVAIRKTGRMVLTRLRSFAERVEDETTAMWSERRRLAAAQAASAEAAEHARIVHDTVINTLAAVANGGAAVEDRQTVRALCEHDLRTLDSMIAGSGANDGLTFDLLVAQLGLVGSRQGLNDADLARIEATLPDDVIRALRGVVYETLRNVVKHAGVHEVELRTAVEQDRLDISIIDRGAGFDGDLIPGRGLAESVFARAQAVEVTVELGAAPGVGTAVHLSCPLADGAVMEGRSPSESADFMSVVARVRLHACWLWAAAVVGVGLVIEVVNRFGNPTPTYGMLAVVAAVGLLAWRDGRGGRAGGYLSLATTVLAVLSVPAAFLLALAGVGFGWDEAITWQCVGVSAPLVILLTQSRSRLPVVIGAAMLVVASATSTVLVAAESSEIAAVIPVGTAPALGIVAGWWFFAQSLDRLGRHAAAERVAAGVARVEQAQRKAAADSQRRWVYAGLSRCRSLLQQIADGTLDVADDAVRSACGDEERFLRQVMLLDPELYRLGPWLARALSSARAKGVQLVVRSGGADVESEETAVAIGDLLRRVIGAAPAGSGLTASLFLSLGKLRFALVAPHPAIGTDDLRRLAPPGWSPMVQTHSGIDIIEMVRSSEPVGHLASRDVGRGEAG